MVKLTSKQIAITSLFAGFYYLFSFLPGIPAPGISGITIQVGAGMATVFGIILGPFLGASATFLGVFIAWLLPPGSMLVSDLFFVPSPILNAITSGLLFQRRWKAAAMSLGLLILTFWLTPPVQPVTEFWNVGIAVTFDKIIALLLIGFVILLDKRFERNMDVSQERRGTPRSWFVPSLLVVSSLLILVDNSLVAIRGSALKFQYDDLAITFGYKEIIEIMGIFNYVWIIVGSISFFASAMLWLKPEKRRVWSVTVMLCSLASVLTGGGFIVGVIIAVVAGFFAFFGNTISYHSLPKLEILRFFVIAFIGNEADNMWGSLIFSFPFVYHSIYSLNVETVRWLFLLSPFAYPAIRFLQAILVTFIGVPLLRTLRAARYIPRVIEKSLERQS